MQMAQNVRKVKFLVNIVAIMLLVTSDAIEMPLYLTVTHISSLREPTIVLSSLIIMNI